MAWKIKHGIKILDRVKGGGGATPTNFWSRIFQQSRHLGKQENRRSFSAFSLWFPWAWSIFCVPGRHFSFRPHFGRHSVLNIGSPRNTEVFIFISSLIFSPLHGAF